MGRQLNVIDYKCEPCVEVQAEYGPIRCGSCGRLVRIRGSTMVYRGLIHFLANHKRFCPWLIFIFLNRVSLGVSLSSCVPLIICQHRCLRHGCASRSSLFLFRHFLPFTFPPFTVTIFVQHFCLLASLKPGLSHFANFKSSLLAIPSIRLGLPAP